MHGSEKSNYDIIIAANVCNECHDIYQMQATVQSLFYQLADNGFLIIIDSALKKTTRLLMACRDYLIERHNAHVIAPCPHNEICPMYVRNKRDWCHYYVDWQCPALLHDIHKNIGIDHRFLKYCFWVFQKNEKNKQVIPRPYLHARAVSSHRYSKGKSEVWVCDNQGCLKNMRLLNKDQSNANLVFSNVGRGDIISLPHHNRTRINKSDTVQRIASLNKKTVV